MKVASFCYHDVVEAGQHSSSGFRRRSSDLYKLERATFAGHLSGLGPHATLKPLSALALAGNEPDRANAPAAPVFLTFDDGGVSAIERTAPMLEAAGWVGHFFIVTSHIGEPGFLSEPQIRELHARGHIVGSHSHTHPGRMSHCSREELSGEWRTSVGILAGILGEPVEAASVPGGYYTRAVAQTAADAGVRVLFNSEPTIRVSRVGGCLVLGRYAVLGSTPANRVAALAQGRLLPRMTQALLWNGKKVVKAAGGEHWLRARQWLLSRR